MPAWDGAAGSEEVLSPSTPAWDVGSAWDGAAGSEAVLSMPAPAASAPSIDDEVMVLSNAKKKSRSPFY